MARNLSLVLLFAAASAFAADADYQFGFLRTGSGAKPISAEERQRLQAAHMAHIGSMAESGALVAAGPIIRSPNVRGIFLFKQGAPARELAAADPYVKAGELAIDLHHWRAPAGIGDRFFEEHKKNPNAPMKMINVQLVVLKSGDPVEEVLARLKASGKLSVSGPVSGGGDVRAICVLRVADVEAARALTGAGNVEVHNWMVADGVLPDPR